MLLFYIFIDVLAFSRLQFLTDVMLKVRLFWNVRRFRIVSSYRGFRESQFRHIQGQAVQRERDFLTLKMKAMREQEENTPQKTSWLHRASNNVEHFLLPTDAHNVKKRRVIKTF